jgi:hypothetical protein
MEIYGIYGLFSDFFRNFLNFSGFRALSIYETLSILFILNHSFSEREIKKEKYSVIERGERVKKMR